MITILNDKSSPELWRKYQDLFDRAWSDLVEYETAPSDINGFTDIASYLAHIEELVEIDPVYVMLPLDEKPININANTRTMDIPPAFKQCSGVQNDEYCEIVTFVIDRYFDYKDLYEADILIQWINGAGQEGITKVVLKDLKTFGDENKIYFGWPLTSQITAAAGDLKFAVRFYNEIDDDGETKYSYIFNTVPNSISIKATLDIDESDVDNIVLQDKDTELFKKFVKNSLNPSYETPTGVQWDENPPSVATIDPDSDSRTIRARASTKDRNTITYAWYRQPIGSESSFLIDVEDDLYSIDFEYDLYEFEDANDWPSSRPVELSKIQLYHKAGVDDYGKVVFEEASGVWPEKQPTKEDEKLYFRSTTLTLNPDTKTEKSDITGYYYAEGTNARTNGSGNIVNSVSSDSGKCLFSKPGTLEVDTDFVDHMFPSEENNSLIFKLKADNGQPQRTYTLYKDGGALSTSFPHGDTFEYEIPSNTYGVYKVAVESTLNRFSANAESSECEVCAHPIQPVGRAVVWNGAKTEKLEEALETETPYFVMYNAASDDETIVLDTGITTSQFTGGVRNYDVGTLSYQWFVSKEDSGDNFEPITEGGTGYGNILSSNVGESTLKIKTRHVVAEDTNIYSYKCVATNTIYEEAPTREFYFVIK